jgi:hypothetical protein
MKKMKIVFWGNECGVVTCFCHFSKSKGKSKEEISKVQKHNTFQTSYSESDAWLGTGSSGPPEDTLGAPPLR